MTKSKGVGGISVIGQVVDQPVPLLLREWLGRTAAAGSVVYYNKVAIAIIELVMRLANITEVKRPHYFVGNVMIAGRVMDRHGQPVYQTQILLPF